MFEILGRSTERPWAARPAPPDGAFEPGHPHPLILHMRANRSHLGQEARACFAVIGVLLVVASFGPALHGFWLVPCFAILAMAALTFALERHGQSAPAQEVLELADGRVRHHDSAGRQTELPSFRMRLATEGCSPADLRLVLRGRDGSIEFGRCLSLDERRAVAPVVAAALAHAGGD